MVSVLEDMVVFVVVVAVWDYMRAGVVQMTVVVGMDKNMPAFAFAVAVAAALRQCPGNIPVLPFCTFRLLMADDAASGERLVIDDLPSHVIQSLRKRMIKCQKPWSIIEIY